MRAAALLLVAGSWIAHGALAQTKMIAHKSHSGKKETFKIALENRIFGLEGSNFGEAPQPLVRTSRLDSVIFLSQKKAIMVTSDLCYKGRTKKSSVWSAGRDTVIDHPLFSKKHDLDSIKTILQTQYYFKNPIDSVAFVGYDNNKSTPTNFTPEIVFEKDNVPTFINKRKVRLQAEIKTESNPDELFIWDSAEEDGDTISLFLNGTCILEKVKLTTVKRAVKVSLTPNSNNYLVLYSHNVGRKPPNTAAAMVNHMGKPKKLFLKADAKYCGAINFIYTPKKKRGETPFSTIRNTPGSPGRQVIPVLALIAAIFSILCGYVYRRIDIRLK